LDSLLSLLVFNLIEHLVGFCDDSSLKIYFFKIHIIWVHKKP